MRVGKKKQPTYRVVAADARSPRNGRFIEIIGTYQPRQHPSVITLENDRAVDWLSKGAQPTEAVAKILAIAGVEKVGSEWRSTAPAEPAEGADAAASTADAS
jgi:small subunit ribosomal protein S16